MPPQEQLDREMNESIERYEKARASGTLNEEFPLITSKKECVHNFEYVKKELNTNTCFVDVVMCKFCGLVKRKLA